MISYGNDNSEIILQKALAIDKATLHQDHPNIAMDFYNLAELYKEIYRFEDAELYYNQALAIQHKNLLFFHSDTGRYYSGLASLYGIIGRLNEAELLYKKALEISRKAIPEADYDTATTLHNLASLYQSMGRYKDALPLYQEALTIRMKILLPYSSEITDSLDALGGLYILMGRYKDAEATLNASEEIYSRNFINFSPLIAPVMIKQSELKLITGKISSSDAERLASSALGKRQEFFRHDKLTIAIYLTTLANIIHHRLRNEDATPLYQEALLIRQNNLIPGHPDIAKSLNNLALQYQSMGRNEYSKPLFHDGFNIEFDFINRTMQGSSSEQLEILIREKCLPTSYYLSSALDAPEFFLPFVYQVQINRKGITQAALARQQKLLTIANTTPELKPIYDQYQTVLAQDIQAPSPENTQKKNELLQQLNREFKEKTGKTIELKRWEMKDVQAKLGINDLLLDFTKERRYNFKTRKLDDTARYYVFAVTKDDVQPHLLTVAEAAPLDQLIQEYRQLQQAPGNARNLVNDEKRTQLIEATEAEQQADLQTKGKELYNTLFSVITPYLRSCLHKLA